MLAQKPNPTSVMTKISEDPDLDAKQNGTQGNKHFLVSTLHC